MVIVVANRRVLSGSPLGYSIVGGERVLIPWGEEVGRAGEKVRGRLKPRRSGSKKLRNHLQTRLTVEGAKSILEIQLEGHMFREPGQVSFDVHEHGTGSLRSADPELRTSEVGVKMLAGLREEEVTKKFNPYSANAGWSSRTFFYFFLGGGVQGAG